MFLPIFPLLLKQNNDKEQWVQVNFGSENLISKIRTFGDRKDSYVTSYKIQLSGDGNNWIDYKQHDTVRVRLGKILSFFPLKYMSILKNKNYTTGSVINY